MAGSALEAFWRLGRRSMIRRLLLAAALLWVGLCLGLFLGFATYTFRFYADWVAQGAEGIWMEWLAYHLIDLRWRAFAFAGVAALPAILSITRRNAA